MSWLLRQARPSDLADLMRLAKKLDSINLPHDESVILDMIRKSGESFAGQNRERSTGQYLFVLEDPKTRAVIGSSQVLDKHGIVNRPHISFKVIRVQKNSRTTGRNFSHVCLKLDWNPEGITEIGGLILDERFRGRPDKLGKLLSYVRFLYMSMHPGKFRPEVLAELLPPLDKNGNSLFWDHVGKKFTGMEYKEANTHCRANAEFMFSLFPHTLIYANLLPEKIQKLIGAVHPDTMPVKQMLERIGFKFSDEVCPFDGGPHYRARMEDITLIKRCQALTVSSEKSAPAADVRHLPALVGHDETGEFRACLAQVGPSGSGVGIDPKDIKLLGLRSGRRAHVLLM